MSYKSIVSIKSYYIVLASLLFIISCQKDEVVIYTLEQDVENIANEEIIKVPINSITNEPEVQGIDFTDAIIIANESIQKQVGGQIIDDQEIRLRTTSNSGLEVKYTAQNEFLNITRTAITRVGQRQDN